MKIESPWWVQSLTLFGRNYGYVTLGGASVGNVIDADMWKFTPGIDEDDDNDYAAGD